MGTLRQCFVVGLVQMGQTVGMERLRAELQHAIVHELLLSGKGNVVAPLGPSAVGKSTLMSLGPLGNLDFWGFENLPMPLQNGAEYLAAEGLERVR
jgi:hypothetical protein